MAGVLSSRSYLQMTVPTLEQARSYSGSTSSARGPSPCPTCRTSVLPGVGFAWCSTTWEAMRCQLRRRRRGKELSDLTKLTFEKIRLPRCRFRRHQAEIPRYRAGFDKYHRRCRLGVSISHERRDEGVTVSVPRRTGAAAAAATKGHHWWLFTALVQPARRGHVISISEAAHLMPPVHGRAGADRGQTTAQWEDLGGGNRRSRRWRAPNRVRGLPRALKNEPTSS